MLRDREEAADAAQQTFLSAHKSLLAGTYPTEPEAWLATIARNECRQRIRRGMAAPLTMPLDEELDGLGDTTFHAAVRGAAVDDLRGALADLPERQREALLLRELRGLSYDEVAASMNTTAPAVETLLVRARKTLARRVGVVPDVAAGWLRELFSRLSGPADAATAAALAATGAAAVLAAVTATGAAVEVEQRVTDDRAQAAVARVDNSGPGSVSSGQARGRGRGRGGADENGAQLSRADDSSGRGRGRGRGRSGEAALAVASGDSSRRSGSSDDSSGSGSGSDDSSGSGSDDD